MKLSMRLMGCRCEVRNWVGVDPKGRMRLIESLSAANPCLTASVIRGTINSTTDAISWEKSLTEGWWCSDGMDWRSSCAICGFLRSVEKTIKNSYLFIIKILFYSGLKSRS